MKDLQKVANAMCIIHARLKAILYILDQLEENISNTKDIDMESIIILINYYLRELENDMRYEVELLDTIWMNN